MFINDSLRQVLAPQHAFEQLMSLRGKRFRYQKGRLTQRVILAEKAYFIKQHMGVGWREIFKNIIQFRWPVLGAKQEKLAIEKLKSLQISVPTIAAFGQRGLNPARRQSFLLLEELTPIISLEDLTKTWKKSPPRFSYKLKLIKEMARIARIMHENGINHRDFYLCHFLLDMHSLEKLYLIDLHRAQIRYVLPQRWIVKDLAGLYFSSKNIGLTQRDLFRFMCLYSSQTLKHLWKYNKKFWNKVKIRGEKLYSEHILS